LRYNRDEKEMLAALNIDSVDRLFDDIPESVRSNLDGLQDGLGELQVRRRVESILGKNRGSGEGPYFLGAGAYDFYVPAAVRAIVTRSEFLTSYTPYQPEVSQGLLFALFEYQSMMAELTGMEVVNNSVYDYATALGEAVLMGTRLSKGKVFLVPEAISKPKLSVVQNYCRGTGIELVQYKFDRSTGCVDLENFKSLVSEDVIGAFVETPNLFGILETQMDDIKQLLDSRILVAGVNALSLGIVRPPGDYDADIVITEGQILGNPVNFGGPHLGVLACKKKYVRKMPGRVIGMTSDADGNRAFCMTLMTREQHIRREKATSNICTNEALTAIATASRLALLGGGGLRNLAISVAGKSRELSKKLNELPGCKAPMFDGAHFNEFVTILPKNASDIASQMLEKKVIPGVPLSNLIDGMGREMLVSVTDKTTEKDMDSFVSVLKEVIG
jgi:glycine dehydrogenase subunit 1